MKTRFLWEETSLTKDNIFEIDIDGFYGDSRLIRGFTKEKIQVKFISHKDEDWEVYNIKGIPDLDQSGKNYYRILMGKNIRHATTGLNKDLMTSDNFGGLVFRDSDTEFVTWQERSRWYKEFMGLFKSRCKQVGVDPKNIGIYIEVMDTGAIQDLIGSVDGILLNPLSGLLNEGALVLPMGGYLDLNEESDKEQVKEVIGKVAGALSIEQKMDESYQHFITRLQMHVFNFEVLKQKHVRSGEELSSFKYQGDEVDEDTLYELSIIKGTMSMQFMGNFIEDMERQVNKSVSTGNTDAIIRSMGKLYSNLLLRVDMGMKLDMGNNKLSNIVSRDLYKALGYGMKLNEEIKDTRKQQFEEKIALLKLQLEREKAAGGLSDDKKEMGQILDVLEGIDDGEASEMLDNIGKEK